MALCFSSGVAFSQINYTANFNNGMNNWQSDYFYQTDEYTCNGAGALIFNLYAWEYAADMISPSIGTTNGNAITLTYTYKLLNFDDDSPVTNAQDWGFIEIYWAPSPAGPFTLIQTVDTSNHVESASCATKTINFTPPAGTPVYLGVYAELGAFDNDFYVVFDQVAATQAALPDCTGTPVASTTVATTPYLCNGGTVGLSLSAAYLNPGISFQWQSSADNTTYANVSTGGTAATYSTTQSASTWYRAKITCAGSAEFVYSTPVQVVNSGIACPCDVVFDEDVEPITSVSFAGINNTSSQVLNGTPSVQNFMNVTPAEVTAGETYPITLKGNTVGEFENYFTVYFDWNHDGDFTDDGEEYQIGMIYDSTGLDAIQATGNIEVPEDALEGLAYMRVFKSYDAYTTDPCSSEDANGFGQVEDYLVNVSLPPCETEAPEAEALQIVCAGSTIADLTAEGAINKWYTAATGGTELTEETVLTATTYYVSQIPEGGCESIERTAVNVQFSIIPPPTAESATQIVCNGGTLADLEVEGDGEIAWYATATGGTALAEPVALTNGTTYYASQSVNGCESATRTAVTVQFSVIPPPVAEEVTQVFCEEGTVADLEVDADGEVVWYASQDGDDVVSDEAELEDGTTYYASQVVDGCESATRTAVTATIMDVDAPVAQSPQSFSLEEGETVEIEDIVVTADGSLTWYESEEDAENNEDAIDAEEYEIEAGETVTLYVVQTIGECVSEPTAITVTTTLGNSNFSLAGLTYYPNPVKDVFTVSYKNTIDVVEVYNLVGQCVVRQQASQNEVALNLGGLAAGTYMVKVQSGTQAGIIKIVKQ